MFLCEKCHEGCGCIAFLPSYGPCEGCCMPDSCVDCHAHHHRSQLDAIDLEDGTPEPAPDPSSEPVQTSKVSPRPIQRG